MIAVIYCLYPIGKICSLTYSGSLSFVEYYPHSVSLMIIIISFMVRFNCNLFDFDCLIYFGNFVVDFIFDSFNMMTEVFMDSIQMEISFVVDIFVFCLLFD
jgi:hypothetical protein